jgi:hypothetical protein
LCADRSVLLINENLKRCENPMAAVQAQRNDIIGLAKRLPGGGGN